MNVSRPYRRQAAGFSLTELLVVLGVIALMAGIIVPTALSRRNLSTANMRTASRELYALLAATKVYAATHNVPTAVVYGIREMGDSHLGKRIQVIDSVAVVRGFKEPDEVTALRDYLQKTDPQKDITSYFRPITHEQGNFNRLSNNVALLPLVYDEPDWVFDEHEMNISAKETGFVPVWLARVEEGGVAGLDPLRDFESPRAFPAHVFLPSGIMRKPAGASERLKLHVGPMPDEAPSLRFETTDGAVNTGRPRFMQLFLFPSTGRVAIAERDAR